MEGHSQQRCGLLQAVESDQRADDKILRERSVTEFTGRNVAHGLKHHRNRCWSAFASSAVRS